MLSSDDYKSAQTGQRVLLVGLSLQLAFFSLFTLLCMYTHRLYLLRHDMPAMRSCFWSLYALIVLFDTRNIFRVIEFVQGWTGYLKTVGASCS